MASNHENWPHNRAYHLRLPFASKCAVCKKPMRAGTEVIMHNAFVYPVDSKQGQELLRKTYANDWPSWF
jgi:hypothetical protein